MFLARAWPNPPASSGIGAPFNNITVLKPRGFFFFVQFFFLCYQPILLPGKLSILRYSKLQVRLDKYFWPSSGGNDYAVYAVDHLSFVKTCKCLIEQPRAWRHARCFFLINIFSGIYATWHSYFF